MIPYIQILWVSKHVVGSQYVKNLKIVFARNCRYAQMWVHKKYEYLRVLVCFVCGLTSRSTIFQSCEVRIKIYFDNLTVLFHHCIYSIDLFGAIFVRTH